MRAAKVISIGQRRLLTLLTAILAIAVVLSFGLVRASATTLQKTTTTISITDASTGNPVGSTIPATELVTITATVTGSIAAPTGSVSFQTTTNGTLYTPMCDSGGNCSWNVSPTGALTSQGSVTMWLPAGTYDIQASFSGTNGAMSSSSPKPGVPVTVTTATIHNTTTTVVASPSSITSGQSSTLTATVTSNDGGGTPQGTVVFYGLVGNVKTFIAQGTLDATGHASFTSSSWATQTYTIEADYLGAVFSDQTGATVQYTSSGGTATLTVGAAVNPQVLTTTTVVATPNVIRSDQSVQLVATIRQQGTSTMQGATLNSSVIFTATSTNGFAVIGTAPLTDNGDGTGTAVLNQAGWVPGTYTITAQYFGNLFYQGSSGSTDTIVVNQAQPSTTTYLHDTQTYVGDTATLSAQVLGPNRVPVPAGETVTLTANDAAGTGCAAITDGNGIASCNATFPAPGTFTVTATYGGDTTYDPSTGFGQIVVKQVPTAVTVTASPSPVPTGASVTLTGHLTDSRTGTPISGKTLTLALNGNETCTTGATNAAGNASCSVTVSEGTGTYQTSASFAGDGPNGRYLPSSGTGSLTVVNVLATNWTYNGTTTVYAGQPMTLSFVLKDANGTILANRNATLSFNGTNYSVTTNASGVASKAITAPATAGPYTPTASYAGEPGYLASTGSGSVQVNTIPTTLTYVGSTSVNGGSSATIAFQLKDQFGQTLSGQSVTLTLPDGSTATVTTDANGIASKAITAPTPGAPTSYPVSATYAGLLPDLPSAGTGSLRVTTIPTAISYNGDTSVVYGHTATLAATLVTSSGQPLGSQLVTLTLASGQQCTGTTNASGAVSCVTTTPVVAAAGPDAVTVVFAGNAPYLGSANTGTLNVISPTVTVISALKPVLQGSSVQLTGTLTAAPGVPLAGQTLTLTIGSQSCTAGPTDATGKASCSIAGVTAPLGPVQTGAGFAGAPNYLASSGSGSTLVYALPSGSGIGNFVVGDLTDAGNVYFWGSQWWTLNALSAGSSPAGNGKGQDPGSFKGFAANVPSPLVCGGTWSTDPGNSTPPPAGPLPAYIGIIVSSNNWKVGSTDFGNIVGLEIVKTNAGYQGDPGHDGTGQVVYGPFCP